MIMLIRAREWNISRALKGIIFGLPALHNIHLCLSLLLPLLSCQYYPKFLKVPPTATGNAVNVELAAPCLPLPVNPISSVLESVRQFAVHYQHS